MKLNAKILLLLIMAFLWVAAYPQAGMINSISISPANPTPSDSVHIFVHCSFPSGGCDPVSASLNQNGNTYNATAMHCQGMLTVICYYTDSFVIPPAPPGNYQFRFQLYSGSGCPCNTTASDLDAVSYNVSYTGDVEKFPDFTDILWSYSSGLLLIRTNGWQSQAATQIKLFDLNGRLLAVRNLENTTMTLPMYLGSGAYVLSLTNARRTRQVKIQIP